MNDDTIKAAEEEAKRFLARVKELRKTERIVETVYGRKRYYYAPKESGAVKRASLDLTRALAAMRRPA